MGTGGAALPDDKEIPTLAATRWCTRALWDAQRIPWSVHVGRKRRGGRRQSPRVPGESRGELRVAGVGVATKGPTFREGRAVVVAADAGAASLRADGRRT